MPKGWDFTVAAVTQGFGSSRTPSSALWGLCLSANCLRFITSEGSYMGGGLPPPCLQLQRPLQRGFFTGCFTASLLSSACSSYTFMVCNCFLGRLPLLRLRHDLFSVFRCRVLKGLLGPHSWAGPSLSPSFSPRLPALHPRNSTRLGAFGLPVPLTAAQGLTGGVLQRLQQVARGFFTTCTGESLRIALLGGLAGTLCTEPLSGLAQVLPPPSIMHLPLPLPLCTAPAPVQGAMEASRRTEVGIPPDCYLRLLLLSHAMPAPGVEQEAEEEAWQREELRPSPIQ